PITLVLDPPLAVLQVRLEARVQEMLAAGFLDEVRALRAAGYGPELKSMQALGYRQLGAVLDGTATLAAAAAETTRATPAYARRARPLLRRRPAAGARRRGRPRRRRDLRGDEQQGLAERGPPAHPHRPAPAQGRSARLLLAPRPLRQRRRAGRARRPDPGGGV